MKQKKKMTSTGFLLLITIVLFFVMYAAGMVIFADKGFAKPQMFLNLFVSNAGLLVISCGLTIVMITGGIDISVGSVTALVCMVMADLMENKGVSAYVAVLAALLIGLAFGIVQGFLVTYMGIQPFIVTLAGMFFGRGMTAIISTDMISIKNEVFLKWANYRFYMPFGSTNKKGKFIPAYIPPTVVIAIIVVLIIAVLLKYFKFGRKLYAIGGNRQSALMMGLDVKKTMFRAYVLDGFLAGLGGFLFCLNSCAGFVEQAKGLEMDAISSAVIGWCWYPDRFLVWCADQRNDFQSDHSTGYFIKLVGTNRTFRTALLLHRDSVCTGICKEEKMIKEKYMEVFCYGYR